MKKETITMNHPHPDAWKDILTPRMKIECTTKEMGDIRLPLSRHTRPRNFTTYYYGGANDKEAEYARIGRSCARDNAIRAAVMKLLTKQFMRADIYGESGMCLGFIKRTGNKIVISIF